MIAQKASGYGVIDAAMNEVTDFFYDLPGEVIQAYPEYFPAQKETLSILEDPEESGGFTMKHNFPGSQKSADCPYQTKKG